MYETNVSFLMRFLVEKNISGMSWINLPAKKYILKSESRSFCKNEIEIDVKDLIGRDKEDPNWSSLADLRMMSFDIECSSYGKFPDARKH